MFILLIKFVLYQQQLDQSSSNRSAALTTDRQ